MNRDSTSDFMGLTNRSAIAFKLGLRGGSGSRFTPRPAWRPLSNDRVEHIAGQILQADIGVGELQVVDIDIEPVTLRPRCG